MGKLLPGLSGRGSTKTRIFMAAAELFSERGYSGVSMREISELSGVSKPTVYYHFKSKEGIYKELLDRGMLHEFESLKRIQELHLPAREKMVEIMKAHFKYSTEYPEFAKFFLKLLLPSEHHPLMDYFKSQSAQRRRALMSIIQEGINSGEFGAGADAELASDIFGAVLGYFMLKQTNSRRKILSEDLAQRVVELLFRGLNE